MSKKIPRKMRSLFQSGLQCLEITKKSLIILHIITLFEKSNFCPKIQFWQKPNIFTSFSSNIFLTIFLVKSKLSTAKKSKTTTFSRVFHPKKIDNYLGKSKLIFRTKNEAFEQCDYKSLKITWKSLILNHFFFRFLMFKRWIWRLLENPLDLCLPRISI